MGIGYVRRIQKFYRIIQNCFTDKKGCFQHLDKKTEEKQKEKKMEKQKKEEM